MHFSWVLFLDDERDLWKFVQNIPVHLTSSSCLVARDFHQGLTFLAEHGCPSFVMFDHDLGDGPTGYDFAKILVEEDLNQNGNFIPKDFSYVVHSANPIGRENIEGYLNHYLRVRAQQ